MKFVSQFLIVKIFLSIKNDNEPLLKKNNIKSLSSFEKLDSSYSTIDLVNKIMPSFDNKANLFDFDYFYNGFGVTIADFDNDGLKHIILSANQTKNDQVEFLLK
tara:strand:- start:201 stop:512 length:312 start_codon:yes stop_codon:yes gene_type:complete